MATHTNTPPGTRLGGSATSRRELLGAGAFTAMFGIAAVAIAKPDAAAAPILSPDAKLLDLAGQFMAVQARIDIINANPDDDFEEELTPLLDAHVALLDEMADIPATTLVGQRARARTLMAWYDVHGKQPGGSSVIEWDRLRPLFRDLMGEAV